MNKKFYIFKDINKNETYIKNSDKFGSYLSYVGDCIWDHIPNEYNSEEYPDIKIIDSDQEEFQTILENAKINYETDIEQSEYRIDNAQRRLDNIENTLNLIGKDEVDDELNSVIEFINNNTITPPSGDCILLSDVIEVVRMLTGKKIKLN